MAFYLEPEEGGKRVCLPSGRTTLGRGPLLEVNDKRVSRNHAFLDLNSDGKLILTPTHANPCFLRVGEDKDVTVLPRDQPFELQDGHVIGFLPDSLYFRVICDKPRQQTETKVNDVKADSLAKNITESPTTNPQSKNEESVANSKSLDSKSHTRNDKQPAEEKDTFVNDTQTKLQVPDLKDNAGQNEQSEIALPLDRKRKLPKWMEGAGARANLDSNENKKTTSKDTAKPVRKATQKAANKKVDISSGTEEEEVEKKVEKKKEKPGPRAANNANRGKPLRRKKSDISDEDDDDDEDVKPKVKKLETAEKEQKKAKQTGRGHKQTTKELTSPTRPARAVAQKKPKYTEDDFVVSDEDWESNQSGSEEEEVIKGGRRKKDHDSDFVVEEEDDSDWEEQKSRGKGISRGKLPPRSKKGRKAKYSDEDENSEESEDEYRPGSATRRKAQSNRRKRRKNSDSEEEFIPRSSRRQSAKGKKKYVESDDEEDESHSDDYISNHKQSAAHQNNNRNEHSEKSKQPNDNEKPTQKTAKVHGDGEEKQHPSAEKKHVISDEEEDKKPASKADSRKAKLQTSSDEDNNVKDKAETAKPKKRKSCMFGKKCYRKNPIHFEEYCHPGDSSYDENDENGDGSKGGRGKENKKDDVPLRPKDKQSVLRGDDDDDNQPNTYDRNDEFINDESMSQLSNKKTYNDSNDDSETEDVGELMDEAKKFVRNKKMIKPT